MAKGGGFLNNPAVIGAGAALVTYVVVEELFDDVIEDFFDAIKGKKKGGKGKNKGGRGGGGGKVKMIKNKFGEVYPVYEDDFTEDAYFGAWERARGY